MVETAADAAETAQLVDEIGRAAFEGPAAQPVGGQGLRGEARRAPAQSALRADNSRRSRGGLARGCGWWWLLHRLVTVHGTGRRLFHRELVGSGDARRLFREEVVRVELFSRFLMIVALAGAGVAVTVTVVMVAPGGGGMTGRLGPEREFRGVDVVVSEALGVGPGLVEPDPFQPGQLALVLLHGVAKVA